MLQVALAKGRWSTESNREAGMCLGFPCVISVQETVMDLRGAHANALYMLIWEAK